jgi:IclR family acetate operon transcriptional repressor
VTASADVVTASADVVATLRARPLGHHLSISTVTRHADPPEIGSREAQPSTNRPGTTTHGGAALVGNKATARVLIVLAQLADGRESYGVSELSRKLGMTKNMVYRALTTLARHGYVVRDPTDTRYQLGPGALRLGASGLPALDLPALSAPAMRRLRDITGETTTLAVPWGRSAVTVSGVRGRGVIARRVPLGRVMPLHISPASRAILAAFPDDAIGRYFEQPLERFNAATLVEPDRLWEEIKAVRRRGYATATGDHWVDSNGVAFPLHSGNGFPHGSITVAGPSERLTDERLEACLPELVAVMADLESYTSLYVAEYSERVG